MALGGLACVGCLAGCTPETRQRVLALFFEDAATSDRGDGSAVPVVRRPRHPLPSTPTPTATPGEAQAEVQPALQTRQDVERLLPKDAVGNPDWVAALAENVIAPRPGVQPHAMPQEILNLDVELTSKTDRAFGVVFSHQKHTPWLACTNCHTQIFEMQAGATPMTAQDVHSSRYCGRCHGTVAFDIATGCPLCHLGNLPKDSNGRVDWSRALAEQLIAPRAGPRVKTREPAAYDLDVDMKSEAQPTFASIFSHKSHGLWLSCANCHPRIFPEASSTIGMGDLHARRYCGACHGSVAFGLTGACARCHPAYEKTKQHQATLDLDVEVAAASPSAPKKIFSHQIHTQWLECPSCHTSEFDNPGGTRRITFTDVAEGQYCARCHGKVSTDLMDHCRRCHVAEEAK
ncbi:MAG: hypothetical protein HY270_02485 [Deltaproteobacteria bacterium]|nr:hypothetical protein [Deltaproteobacteria bacterium]